MGAHHRILFVALLGFAGLGLVARLIESDGKSISAAAQVDLTTVGDGVPSSSVDDLLVTDVVEPFETPGAFAPTTTIPLALEIVTSTVAADNGCADSGHSAVIDRDNQRAWLCNDNHVTEKFVMTSANSQPDVGTYKVYAKDLNAASTLTGKYSTMTHFVAFTKGKYRGARIAFHSIPKYSNGEYIQSLESVGTAEMHGASSGCIRVLPDDSVKIWNWLATGDPVTVVS